jgi:adenylate kinase
MSRVVILLGPPGAGKGTQASRLAGALGLPHVSTGDLLRQNLERGTQLGQRARRYMEGGQLVPDDVVLEMLFERVAQKDCARGYLLDGFPRTMPQAAALESRIAHNGQKARIQVLNLNVPDEVVLERLSGRRTCRQCGNVHHVRSAPPRVDGSCDRCGGELYQRSDDAPEVVGRRLAVYRRETQPLEAYYSADGRLRDVDGDQGPDQVFSALKSSVQEGEAA